MTNYSVLRHAAPLGEAAERYGTVRRGFMRCPFHEDRVPSLKLYDDHFHCFGCGAHGDVVDLTAGLLGCSKAEAARRLAADFGSGAAHPRGLAACKRELERCRRALAPRTMGEEPREEYAEACRLGEWAGYLLDVGAGGAETRHVERETARLMEARDG